MSQHDAEILAALQNEIGLDLPGIVTEAAILEMLEARVGMLLQKGPEPFFQLMYRLDISEKKLNHAMQDENVPGQVARLIYDRQLQKIMSRQQYKDAQPPREDKDIEW